MQVYTSERNAKFLRKYDKHAFKGLAKHGKDQRSYLSIATKHIAELEEHIQLEFDDHSLRRRLGQ
jgi:hypothetical protein